MCNEILMHFSFCMHNVKAFFIHPFIFYCYVMFVHFDIQFLWYVYVHCIWALLHACQKENFLWAFNLLQQCVTLLMLLLSVTYCSSLLLLSALLYINKLSQFSFYYQFYRWAPHVGKRHDEGWCRGKTTTINCWTTNVE